ncbi:MAG: hypothetical protein RL223_2538 [Pseudomonadota bacterium]|jgi:hypothetical protein
MPHGKPAGVPCVQLDEQLRCRIFGRPERPDFCGGLQPSAEMCGSQREHAMRWLTRLEEATRPDPPAGMAGASGLIDTTGLAGTADTSGTSDATGRSRSH